MKEGDEGGRARRGKVKKEDGEGRGETKLTKEGGR